MERRSQLALLRAVGFSREKIKRLVMAEHSILLLLGLATGTTASMFAIWPAIRSPLGVAVETIGVFLAGIAILGILWIYAAATMSLRGNLISALREE